LNLLYLHNKRKKKEKRASFHSHPGGKWYHFIVALLILDLVIKIFGKGLTFVRLLSCHRCSNSLMIISNLENARDVDHVEEQHEVRKIEQPPKSKRNLKDELQISSPREFWTKLKAEAPEAK
jgi:hypothetical protein